MIIINFMSHILSTHLTVYKYMCILSVGIENM